MMRPVRTTIAGLSLALGLLATAGPAHAGFQVTGYDYLNTAPVTVSRTGVPAFNYSNSIGVFAWNPLGAFPAGLALDGGGKLRTFCIEIPETVSPGQHYTFTAQPLGSLPEHNGGGPNMGDDRADDIAKLWAAYHGTLGSNSTLTAAFQVAIWAIIYGNGTYSYDTDVLTSGAFTAANNNAVTGQAKTWLSSLGGLTDRANLVGFKVTLGESQHQDQVGELLPGGDIVEAVPVPPAVALAFAGLLPCVFLRRRLLGKPAA